MKKIDMREKWNKVSLVVVVKKIDSFAPNFMVATNIQIEKKRGSFTPPSSCCNQHTQIEKNIPPSG
jgi:hypothetical protein